MNIPSSTYRVQLHQGFQLNDLHRIVSYLHTLGVSTIYASPITQAAPESMHGYDVTDPHKVNAELGSVDDLHAIAQDLRKNNMYWLQDIVPNHMAFHPMNFRLMDVLERGPASPYYNYFDIDWNHPDPDLKGRVMAPFLGSEIESCLERGEISVAFSDDGFTVNYFNTAYPLSVSAYPALGAHHDSDSRESGISSILRRMAAAADGSDYGTWSAMKAQLLNAIAGNGAHRDAVDEIVARLNQNSALLRSLLDQQYYLLCWWKETESRINYRRFFTVNELICLRMEDEGVFNEYHHYLHKLWTEKLIHGFRIDHIDGLQDPAGYCQRLRQCMGESCYIIAEKILEAKEDMPAQWPLQGTSGYEFLSFLNRLLTHRKGAGQLLTFYQQLVPGLPPYRTLMFESKKLILENYMLGEWNNLTRLFRALKLAGSFDDNRVKQALGIFMLSLPVYRIYPDRLPLKGKSLLVMHEAFEKALAAGGELSAEINHLRKLFTEVPENAEDNDRILAFLKRLMQFTGPLTAKGVEDTTFYIYNPLISHDEVGDSPKALGMSIQRFHEKMIQRQAGTPLSLNATATHDTKRGEDARVRINVLSRIPELWQENVIHWLSINSCCRESASAPQLNDEYFIYQSMLGGFPEDFRVTDEWIRRVQAYLNKALREAKVNTNWSAPDEEYEKACEQFIERILDEKHTFLSSFVPFVKTVCEHAMVYSLSQTLVKLTAPGIPDIYQGCELWDLSFVDPDNRRPVDFDRRMQFLFQLVLQEEKGMPALLDYLRENREAGIEKLYVIWKTLNFRRTLPLLFTEGSYVPLALTGSEITAAAYARVSEGVWVLVVIPLGLIKHDLEGIADKLSGQYLVLPEDAPENWVNILTGEIFEATHQIALIDLFMNFPVALLTNRP